jgi:hypothetical protein
MCRYICACVYVFVNILKKTLKFFKNKKFNFLKKYHFFDPQRHLFTKLCVLKRDSAPPGREREFHVLSF